MFNSGFIVQRIASEQHLLCILNALLVAEATQNALELVMK